MVVAIICEFCNKWCFGVFDTIVPVYGEGDKKLDSFIFSMMSVVGSLFNIVQTGWLYNFLIKKDLSIPTVSCLSGIAYVIAFVLCMSPSKILYIIGGVMIIVGYGFAAPTAAAIMSVRDW